MTRRQADDRDCARVRELEAEFVLGTLDGHERADVVEHLATCARCRDGVASLSGAVSDLALLAPRVPPSPGFTNRVLAAMGPTSSATSAASASAADPALGLPVGPALGGLVRIDSTGAATSATVADRRRRRPMALLVAVAAAVVLLVAGFAVVRRDAPSRGVLAVAAMVDPDGNTIGVSGLVNDVPGQVWVAVVYPSNWLDYRLEAVDTAGRPTVLGAMHLDSGAWKWAGRLPSGELQTLRIVRPDGTVTCIGALPV